MTNPEKRYIMAEFASYVSIVTSLAALNANRLAWNSMTDCADTSADTNCTV